MTFGKNLMLNRKQAEKLKGALIQAVQILDAALEKDRTGVEPCQHEDTIDMTTMGAKTRTIMCGNDKCNKIWEEQIDVSRLGRGEFSPSV